LSAIVSIAAVVCAICPPWALLTTVHTDYLMSTILGCQALQTAETHRSHACWLSLGGERCRPDGEHAMTVAEHHVREVPAGQGRRQARHPMTAVELWAEQQPNKVYYQRSTPSPVPNHDQLMQLTPKVFGNLRCVPRWLLLFVAHHRDAQGCFQLRRLLPCVPQIRRRIRITMESVEPKDTARLWNAWAHTATASELIKTRDT
jgi:hypothetical protein